MNPLFLQLWDGKKKCGCHYVEIKKTGQCKLKELDVLELGTFVQCQPS